MCTHSAATLSGTEKLPSQVSTSPPPPNPPTVSARPAAAGSGGPWTQGRSAAACAGQPRRAGAPPGQGNARSMVCGRASERAWQNWGALPERTGGSSSSSTSCGQPAEPRAAAAPPLHPCAYGAPRGPSPLAHPAGRPPLHAAQRTRARRRASASSSSPSSSKYSSSGSSSAPSSRRSRRLQAEVQAAVQAGQGQGQDRLQRVKLTPRGVQGLLWGPPMQHPSQPPGSSSVRCMRRSSGSPAASCAVGSPSRGAPTAAAVAPAAPAAAALAAATAGLPSATAGGSHLSSYISSKSSTLPNSSSASCNQSNTQGRRMPYGGMPHPDSRRLPTRTTAQHHY